MSLRDLYLGFRLSFETPEDQEDSEEVILRVMGLNARLNAMYLRNHPDTLPLYESHVLYTPPDQCDGRPPISRSDLRALLALIRKMGRDPETALMVVRMLKGMEIFLDLPALYRRGKGDCNELVPVRLAECWRAGMLASPYLTKELKEDGGGFAYHALILHQDGSSEDPSLILGMGSQAARQARLEEIRKNCERQDNLLLAGQYMVDKGVPAEVVGRQIDAMGFVPRDGVFHSPYEERGQIVGLRPRRVVGARSLPWGVRHAA